MLTETLAITLTVTFTKTLTSRSRSKKRSRHDHVSVHRHAHVTITFTKTLTSRSRSRKRSRHDHVAVHGNAHNQVHISRFTRSRSWKSRSLKVTNKRVASMVKVKLNPVHGNDPERLRSWTVSIGHIAAQHKRPWGHVNDGDYVPTIVGEMMQIDESIRVRPSWCYQWIVVGRDSCVTEREKSRWADRLCYHGEGGVVSHR